MKKSLILLPILMLSLAACNDPSNSTSKPTSEPNSQTSAKPNSGTIAPEPEKEYGIVDTPVVGTAYKIGLNQPKAEEPGVYFLTDEVANTYYFAGVKEGSKALDVKLEEVTGGYVLTTTVNSAKKYIEAVKSGKHVNIKFLDTATADFKWTYKAEWKTVVATFDEVDYYMGTKGTFTTFGCYAGDTAAENYVSHFYHEDGHGEYPTITFPVTALEASDITVEAEKSKTINVTITPSHATNKELTFVSANEAIATVSAEGVVTGVAEGTTKITITSVGNPEVSKEINVTVNPKSTEPVNEETAVYNFVGALAAGSTSAKQVSTSEAVVALFKTESDVKPLSAEGLNWVYAGANGGGTGAEYVNFDVLKYGKASAVGGLTLNFDAGIKISKVECVAAQWKTGMQMGVNGVNVAFAGEKMSSTNTGETLTFELPTETNSLVFTSTGGGNSGSAVCIFSMTITFTR